MKLYTLLMVLLLHVQTYLQSCSCLILYFKVSSTITRNDPSTHSDSHFWSSYVLALLAVMPISFPMNVVNLPPTVY